MLSPADAALVERDPAITGLAVLLDPAAVAERLRAALPDVGITSVEPTYVRYKPQTSCLVAYRVGRAAGDATIYARGFAPALRPKLRHAQQLCADPGALGVGGLILDDLDIAVYSWPHDHGLPALARLVAPRWRARLLAECCPARADLHRAALVDLRHRPERRYVGCLTNDAGGGVLLKLYCEGDYAPAHAAATAFRSAGALRVAPLLGRSDQHRILLFPWQAGRPLAELLWGKTCDQAALRLTGQALASLHAQVVDRLPGDNPSGPLDAVHAAAQAVAAICPELALRASNLADELAAELGARPVLRRPLHGDFYADQVLIGEGHAAVLDLDNAHWGEPAADLGNFFAHLQKAVIGGAGSAAEAAQLGEMLRQGYADGGTLPPERRIRLHAAASLLRLAAEPFRRRCSDWPAQISALVAAAEQTCSQEERDASLGT